MKINIFWYRRDLRIEDNHGLFKALQAGRVLPVFIFDPNILDRLPKDDARVGFIYEQIKKLKEKFKSFGSDLRVYYAKPLDAWQQIMSDFDIEAVYTNHDYEPYAIQRDAKVSKILEANSIPFYTFKDQVIFEKDEVVKDDKNPYTVFTPYSKKWKKHFYESGCDPYPSEDSLAKLYNIKADDLISLSELGFKPKQQNIPSKKIDLDILKTYSETRDLPYLNSGTSRLGLHLRFGTISIRGLVEIAAEFNETYLNELIWREFYMQILYHFPKVAKGAFRDKYNKIPWINNEEQFELWKQGKTGFPLVDAGMRELNETGYMHNRVRMVVASFLCKNLLIDWRWGEAYFTEKLLDFDLAANNGGWQWTAGTGCDAAPYFRVFNPISQQKTFDPDLKYIQKWVPEYPSFDYPQEMVDLKTTRLRAIEAYKSVS